MKMNTDRRVFFFEIHAVFLWDVCQIILGDEHIEEGAEIESSKIEQGPRDSLLTQRSSYSNDFDPRLSWLKVTSSLSPPPNVRGMKYNF